MKVSDVTKEDGQNCAQLLNALKVARFDNLQVSDVEVLVSVKKWVHGLALQMATVLKERSAPSAPAPTMRVKSIKPMPPSSPSKSKQKKKK